MTLNAMKRGFVVMVTALTLAFYISYDKASSQTTQSPEKTIEQTHKDIKVLNGQPDSQLSPIMNYFGASLGVNCAFCHALEGDRIAFDKDHEHKTIAREMVKMVQEINKNNFNGKNEISCFTCHQGRPIPAAVPTLPLPAPLNFGGPRPPAGAPALTAEQVWEKYVNAVGGKDAIAKIKSSSIKSTFVVGNNPPLENETKIEGAKIVASQKVQDGEALSIYNGTEGWMKDQRGARALRANEIAAIKNRIEFLAPIKFVADPAEKISLGRKTKIGDRDVIVLRTMRDKKSVTLFFDAETSLLLRKQTVSEMYLGKIPEQIDYEDYKEVDGLKLPMTIRLSGIVPQATGIQKLTEVKHNVNFDANIFAAPAK